MNILFFLTPKSMCAYLEDKSTLRQALERMEVAGYAALPILNEKGEYCGTLTEGDMLWAVKIYAGWTCGRRKTIGLWKSPTGGTMCR